jgi:hypothetical protein
MRADDPGPEPLPVDPDADAGTASPAGEGFGPLVRKGVLVAVALGGLPGGLARYFLEFAFPASAGGFPLTTFAINVSGSFSRANREGCAVLRVEPRRRSAGRRCRARCRRDLKRVAYGIRPSRRAVRAEGQKSSAT